MTTNPPPASPPRPRSVLFGRVSQSVYWNTLLLPLVTICSIATSVLVRRRFGLTSGAYDILLGTMSTVLFYSSLGIPSSLMKILPEREMAGGRSAVLGFLWRATAARLLLLAALVVPLNLFAERVARWSSLGPDGAADLHLLTALIVARGIIDLIVYVLYAFLAQLRVNLLILLQSLLDPTLVAVALALGGGIGAVILALASSAAVVATIGGLLVWQVVCSLPAQGGSSASAPSAAWKFSLFDYLVEISRYFGGADFSRTVLGGVLGDRGGVAIFAVGFYLAFMVVNLIVSVFRGIYRPMFARLRAEGGFARLQQAFSAISKTQIALLLPAAAGLAVMAPDYVRILYGGAFAPAVSVARILIVLLVAETAFNQTIMILSVDEQYASVLGAMAIQALAAPVLLAAASLGGVEAAAAVLGASRAATTATGYLVCRRLYGLRFPWAFTGRVGAAAAAMALVLAAVRLVWGTSPLEAATLTIVGVLVFVAGVRLSGAVGREEAELLRRADIPGSRAFLDWLFGRPLPSAP